MYRAAITDPDSIFVTVEHAAELTQTSPQMIRRYIRSGVVSSIQNPHDKRGWLIPIEDLAEVIKRGHEHDPRKVVELHGSDGTVRKILVHTKK
jgi:hypothetical protein